MPADDLRHASRVAWWEPHPIETGTLIWLKSNDGRPLHVDQSMEEILPQIS
jgi:hypothetical protein